MFRRYFLALLILLLPATATADERVEGHMVPLTTELLGQPVTLSCGLTIKEWRGESQPSQAVINQLNTLCTRALKHFKPFLTARNLQAPRSGAFKWSLALIPDGTCYRCVNDIKYRFKYRFVKQALWGYTGRDETYSFTVSDVKMAYYKTIFTHELFHAMSMYYGLYDSHSSNDAEKTEKDEVLAKSFTQSLGLGQ